MSKSKITLYVDTVSPFAYLAFYVIRTHYVCGYVGSGNKAHSPVFRKCDVEYVPVFLGGIMKACGNTPPLFVKNKDKWINTERKRWARLFNVPMAEGLPEGFPQPTLQIQRVLTAMTIVSSHKLPDTIEAIYKAFFVDLNPIHKDNGFQSIFRELLREEGTEVLTKSTTDEVKKLLTANTEKALADGSFGLPWYVATNTQGKTECYWGFDHLGQVADHLGLERPKPVDGQEGGWKAML